MTKINNSLLRKLLFYLLTIIALMLSIPAALLCFLSQCLLVVSIYCIETATDEERTVFSWTDIVLSFELPIEILKQACRYATNRSP